MNNTKKYWLYVLKLENNNYYVGVTSKTPQIRFRQHVNGFAGAKWTKKYKPISIHDTKDLGIIKYQQAAEYEDKVVRKYIKKYGLEHVRGGDLSYSESLIDILGWAFSEEALINFLWFLAFAAIMFGLVFYKHTN